MAQKKPARFQKILIKFCKVSRCFGRLYTYVFDPTPQLISCWSQNIWRVFEKSSRNIIILAWLLKSSSEIEINYAGHRKSNQTSKNLADPRNNRAAHNFFCQPYKSVPHGTGRRKPYPDSEQFRLKPKNTGVTKKIVQNPRNSEKNLGDINNFTGFKKIQ